MDPSAYAAYGYGDNNFGDPSNDPISYAGWNQWNQPSALQQHQQQLQPSFFQSQVQPKPFGSFPSKNFQQKMPQQGQKPGNRGGLGFNAVNSAMSNFSSLGLGSVTEWSQPPTSQQFSIGGQFNNRSGGFPKKGGNNFGGASLQQWRNKKSTTSKANVTNYKGKTPAMVLHELFKTVEEEFVEVETVPKKYRCILSITSRKFEMESFNKKTAKQKCSELAIRTLRPDIELDPYEEVVPKTPAQGQKRNASSMSAQPTESAGATKKVAPTQNVAKKAKPNLVDSSASLFDFMKKLISQSQLQYTPTFDIVEVPAKTESDEESNGGAKKATKSETLITITLKLDDNGKILTRTGTNKHFVKELLIREALLEIFNVPIEDIRKISRRLAMNRVSPDAGIAQTLQQIASILNCTVSYDIGPAEDRPLGDGKMFYAAKCKIVDHFENDNETVFQSPALGSKPLARDFAAAEVLKNYFEIDPSNSTKLGDNPSNGPCAILHTLMAKQMKQTAKVVYEFKENVPPVAGKASKDTQFYCDCIVNENDRYTGSGRSKKLAKNQAAIVAIKKIFNIDYDPNASFPLSMNKKTSPTATITTLCRDVSEFSKREYHQMCQFYDIVPSNQIATFFLVNEKNEKRIVAIGSSLQYVVEPDTLNGANGTSLLHMDPMVLARRSLIRYLLEEYKTLKENPIGSVFELNANGKAQLKPNLKLVLYSNFPPVCSYSVEDAVQKKLAFVTPTSLKPCPDDLLSFDEIKATKNLRIQCTADKLFKWNRLGIQGALLSTLMEPIYLSHLFFGSVAPVPDESLKYALAERLGSVESNFTVESVPTQMRLFSSYGHSWTRGVDVFESIDYNTGRTMKGSPSALCKAEIYQAFLKCQGLSSTKIKYYEAKESAEDYQNKKKQLYSELERAGLGKWQQKPTNLVDDFAINSFDI